MASLTCASCNIRYDEPKDKYPWSERKHLLSQLILERRPDFLATQEGRKPQLDELHALIETDYRMADGHRDYRDKRMYPALFVRKDWQIEHSTDRWLSHTPTLVGSTGFGSRWPKLAVYAQVAHAKHPKSIHLASFHFDNVSDAARPRQASVLVTQLKLIYPNCTNAFLMGDANDEPSAPSLQTMRDAGFNDSFAGEGQIVTFHDFGRFEHAAHIDYILSQSEDYKQVHAFLDDRRDNFYSDHYFMSATFQLS